MRVGNNPAKEDSKVGLLGQHRIIIPVYIPDLEQSYFKDGLIILKYCLESILATSNDSIKISIFNNGSCTEVGEYLEKLYLTEEKIDQLINSKINIGKVNAINSIVKSTESSLYTISDADVLFLNNWQENVEKIFENFPEAGMVSPVPSSKAFSYYTCATVFFSLFKGKLTLDQVKDPEALIMFEKSIGNKLYKPCHLENYLVVNSDLGKKAVMGCGHFVATMRKEVFEHSPNKPSGTKISSGSEAKYLDIPNDEAGLLRLSTLRNFAYHLGNVQESWMDEQLKKIKTSKIEYKSSEISKPKPITRLNVKFGKLISRIIFGRFFKQFKMYKKIHPDY